MCGRPGGLRAGLEALRREGARATRARAAKWSTHLAALALRRLGRGERRQGDAPRRGRDPRPLDDPGLESRRGRARAPRARRPPRRPAGAIRPLASASPGAGVQGAPDVGAAVAWAVIAVRRPDSQERARAPSRAGSSCCARRARAALTARSPGRWLQHLLGRAPRERGRRAGRPGRGGRRLPRGAAEGVRGSRWARPGRRGATTRRGRSRPARPLLESADKRALRLVGMAHALGRGAPRDDRQAVTYLLDARRRGTSWPASGWRSSSTRAGGAGGRRGRSSCSVGARRAPEEEGASTTSAQRGPRGGEDRPRHGRRGARWGAAPRRRD